MTQEMQDYIEDYGINSAFEQADRDDEAEMVDQFLDNLQEA